MVKSGTVKVVVPKEDLIRNDPVKVKNETTKVVNGPVKVSGHTVKVR